MTQEDKELLLKDLSARLPYYVKAEYPTIDGRKIGIIDGIYRHDLSVEINDNEYSIFDIKPYLFPMSSMTEEQKREYNKWKHDIPVCRYEYGDVVEEIELYESPESFEYLIENHFDYQSLIPMGLANDATGLNIY